MNEMRKVLALEVRFYIILLTIMFAERTHSKTKLPRIAGLGQIDIGVYFIEMYISDGSANLSDFTISTETVVYLPDLNFSKRKFLMITNNKTAIGTFFPHYKSRGKAIERGIRMRHGNDGVALRNWDTDNTVDLFGGEITKDACVSSCSYKLGWVHRIICDGPKQEYKAQDWSVARDVFNYSTIKHNRMASYFYPITKECGTGICIHLYY